MLSRSTTNYISSYNPSKLLPDSAVRVATNNSKIIRKPLVNNIPKIAIIAITYALFSDINKYEDLPSTLNTVLNTYVSDVSGEKQVSNSYAQDILKFIEDKSNVKFLLSSLLEKIIPNLIGEYSSSLSIFEDLEEGWENLYIQIKNIRLPAGYYYKSVSTSSSSSS